MLRILWNLVRLASLGWLASAPGCTSARIVEQSSLASIRLKVAEPRDELRLVWTQRTPGIVTDLAFAKDTGHLLVSMNPDPDGSGPLKKAMSVLMNREGKPVWRNYPKSRVRAQALSPDGNFAVVTSYDEKVSAFDNRGRLLWQLDKLCRPILLPSQKLIVCYYDDDSEPHTAFDLISWEGKILLSEPIDREILALAVSPDGEWIAYALQGGALKTLRTDSLLATTGRKQSTRQLDGEIVDLGFSSAPEKTTAHVFALLNARIGYRPRAQSLLQIDAASGQVLSHTVVPAFAQSMSFSSNGTWGALYGNNPQGQGILQIHTQPQVKIFSRLLNRNFADFSSTLHTSQHRVVLGLENIEGDGSTVPLSHIIALDPDGVLHWSLDLRPEDAGYQIDMTEIDNALYVIVTTDSGTLSLYQAPAK